jgi:N utilization substance protein B
VTASKKDHRRRAREATLQILYQSEIARTDVAHAVATYFDCQWPDPLPPADELRAFAETLAHDTMRQLPAIDTLIAETSQRWRPERMPVLDRLILRMAASELLRNADTPPAVIINEALELAKRFSSDESVGFINGMLDSIRKKIDR